MPGMTFPHSSRQLLFWNWDRKSILCKNVTPPWSEFISWASGWVPCQGPVQCNYFSLSWTPAMVTGASSHSGTLLYSAVEYRSGFHLHKLTFDRSVVAFDKELSIRCKQIGIWASCLHTKSRLIKLGVSEKIKHILKYISRPLSVSTHFLLSKECFLLLVSIDKTHIRVGSFIICMKSRTDNPTTLPMHWGPLPVSPRVPASPF